MRPEIPVATAAALPAIDAVENATYPRIADFVDAAHGCVGTGIIHQNEFEPTGKVIERRDDFLGEWNNVFFLVKRRNNNGKKNVPCLGNSLCSLVCHVKKS